MRLIPIFVGEKSEDSGLLAIQYQDGPDEFERLFDLWYDVEYLDAFFREHFADLLCLHKAYAEELVERSIVALIEEAEELETMLVALVISGSKGDGQNLQQLFKPLDNRIYELKPLQKSKASIRTKTRLEPKLRVYAIRLASNLYIITGGAIKLTHTMNERTHFVEEIRKIGKVREWLNSKGIFEPEDLNEEQTP